jgi:hypothetical protein
LPIPSISVTNPPPRCDLRLTYAELVADDSLDSLDSLDELDELDESLDDESLDEDPHDDDTDELDDDNTTNPNGDAIATEDLTAAKGDIIEIAPAFWYFMVSVIDSVPNEFIVIVSEISE